MMHVKAGPQCPVQAGSILDHTDLNTWLLQDFLCLFKAEHFGTDETFIGGRKKSLVSPDKKCGSLRIYLLCCSLV
jgi:hypothetical protein